ncbi:RNA polymerase sigma factor [Schumannella sp. 10F1B-5-1]|uniref:RNA polymerase sigma factor n=1 Tax=Schumannella sp. 10F1B-5-1 TaxID=2590780 RepID=UPI0011300AF7|nr:sigma-70 family RNA polymerase sigma factor [Schumannella sp. 10F1B-5-1]TPW71676.1 sigma-70 family RNA polymerase sigma factor [Schumannella sp. 10F1B-5-1]
MSGLDSAADALLAQRAADGDELAFAVLVRRHASYLRAFALRLTRSGADADDAVQDALITAWDKLPELRDPRQVRGWLATIVARKATDRIRARRVADDIDDHEPAATASGPEERAELSQQMRELTAALDELPDEVRITWTLREVSGASYDEIAARLDVPVSTVRGRLARARAHLLERMMEWRRS